MFRFDKERRAGIVTGVIATMLFIYLLQPILNFVSILVTRVSTIVSSAYVDQIYKEAASLETQNYAFLLILFLFGLLSMLFFTVGIRLVVGKKLIRSTFRPIGEALFNRDHPILRIGFGVFQILIAIFYLVIASANYTQLSIIATFQQQMRVVAPYISDLQGEQLYSQWSQMRSKKDYDSINNKLHAIALQHQLELPENALYTPTTL